MSLNLQISAWGCNKLTRKDQISWQKVKECQLIFEKEFFKKKEKKSPDTVEEVTVIVIIDIKGVSYFVVQHCVTVLEVVENTEDGAVVIVRGQRGQANIFQGDVLALIWGHYFFNVKLQIQHLVGWGWEKKKYVISGRKRGSNKFHGCSCSSCANILDRQIDTLLILYVDVSHEPTWCRMSLRRMAWNGTSAPPKYGE